MFCPQCGSPVQAGQGFCHACGRLLTPVAGAAPSVASAPAPALEGHGLARAPWLRVLLLNAVTLGVYALYWWWTRAGGFDKLRAAKKFGNRALFLVLVLAPVGSLIQLSAQAATGRLFVPNPATPPSGTELAGLALSLVAGINGIVFAFRGRRMLLDHYHSQGRADVRVSAVWTLLFNIVYLQYKLEKLP